MATLVMLAITALWAPQLAQWDERSAGLSWRMADQNARERRVVVLDIDEKSVQTLGSWPWPRARQAELLEALDRAGVGLKLLDILFDGTGPDDARLVRALASPVPTVLAQVFSLSPEPPVRSGRLGGALALAACPEASVPAYGYMAPAPGFVAASPFVGHITPLIDPDGAVRRVPALVCHDGKTYAALPVAGLMAATEAKPILTPGRSVLDPSWWLEFGDIRVPLDATGQLRVSYRMPRAGFVSVSAVDLLQGRVPADLLRGAWVLVGATAFGARDAVPTPQGGAVGGVEVHAQALAALLDERTPYTPRGAPFWPWLAGAGSALLLLVTLHRISRGVGLVVPVVAVVSVAALFGLHTLLLLTHHLWLGWTVPGLFTLLTAVLLTAGEFARTRYERERLYRNLASYLPEPVAREVATQDLTAQVRATRREATVLYADLRNFSFYCEGRPPEETAMVLHMFFTTASRIVEAHGGVVEQMVGDGILAVWNGSAPCADHAICALEAARVLWQDCTPQFPLIVSNRIPPLDLGIGIESGTVLVGSFGPASRRVHTVLGEAVSAAARLQALTGDLACPILVGASAASSAVPPDAISAPDQRLRRLGDFLLQGFMVPRTVYELPVAYPSGRLHLAFDADNEQQAVG
jgi:adenylate cyclase